MTATVTFYVWEGVRVVGCYEWYDNREATDV